MIYRITLLLLSLWFCHASYGQDVEIEINNPSFEGIPHRGHPDKANSIKGWYDCGQMIFPTESPPDLHPLVEEVIKPRITEELTLVRDTVRQAVWQVTQGPSDGRTYLGLVVRSNDTWESLSQRLKVPIEEGKCYGFDIELSRSEFYVSGSKITEQLENYTQPAVLRIWGGTGVCGKQELLGESVTVSNNDWRTYEFEFRPNKTVNYFTLEAFFKVPTLFPYNGHLLLDNASLIKEIPCDNEEIPANEADEIVLDAPSRPKIPVKTAPAPKTESLQVEDVVASTSVEEPEIIESKGKKIKGLAGSKFRKDQIIRVNSIYFDFDSSSFNQQSFEALEEIYDFMKENKNLVIEVGGHTNTVPSSRTCDVLSSNRAKSVASYLAKKGISTKRLYYKGYGKRKPIEPNDKYNKEARKKNQRVEIKILKTDFKTS